MVKFNFERLVAFVSIPIIGFIPVGLITGGYPSVDYEQQKKNQMCTIIEGALYGMIGGKLGSMWGATSWGLMHYAEMGQNIRNVDAFKIWINKRFYGKKETDPFGPKP